VVALSNGEVLMIIAVAAIPIAAITFALGAGSALREIGKGKFAIEQELPQKSSGAPPTSPAVREAEIRQMVEAKAYRQQERGEGPLDVDAEVSRLVNEQEQKPAGGRDEELRAEVRQLVIARNERRMRKGQEPLDVEVEVDRQLRELENLGQ
jgi:hypothetical protein